eukprot:9261561-Alexandrium_andersonii.AAC.1
MPDCAFVGRNRDWVDDSKSGGGHYACPRCGTWYQPFKTGTTGRLACNKVMVVQVKDGNAPLMLDGKVVIHKGEAAVYPIWWADTLSLIHI